MLRIKNNVNRQDGHVSNLKNKNIRNSEDLESKS
jgi:hypothetical protein